MGRLTSYDAGNEDILVNEEERLLSSNGFIDKYEMYKIMRHLAEKVFEYENLDEQGLLLRLPCKVGETVYAIRYGEENDFIVVETKIIEIRQNINGTFFEPLISRKAYKTEDFGKEVFLTKAEAEQKLKEMSILGQVQED